MIDGDDRGRRVVDKYRASAGNLIVDDDYGRCSPGQRQQVLGVSTVAGLEDHTVNAALGQETVGEGQARRSVVSAAQEHC